MSRWLRALPALCFAAVLGAAACISAADARADVLAWRGRLSIGYGKLFFNGAPGGGFSTLVGVDLPVRSRFRLGPEIAFHLLGTRSIDSGGANANIDYSLFEFGVQAHWLPAHAGMIHRVSLGPAMMRSLADISASSAGLMFEPLAHSQLRPGLTFDLALAPHGEHVVTVGIEAGTRIVFLKSENWTAATLRLLFEY